MHIKHFKLTWHDFHIASYDHQTYENNISPTTFETQNKPKQNNTTQHNATQHNTTQQNTTKQNKTKQNKTKQNKTRFQYCCITY